MNDDKWVMGCLLEALFIWIMFMRLLSQPLVECSDDNVPHVPLFQDVIDIVLGCTEQDLALG